MTIGIVAAAAVLAGLYFGSGHDADPGLLAVFAGILCSAVAVGASGEKGGRCCWRSGRRGVARKPAMGPDSVDRLEP